MVFENWTPEDTIHEMFDFRFRNPAFLQKMNVERIRKRNTDSTLTPFFSPPFSRPFRIDTSLLFRYSKAMFFPFTEAQRLLQRTLREFVAREVSLQAAAVLQTRRSGADFFLPSVRVRSSAPSR